MSLREVVASSQFAGPIRELVYHVKHPRAQAEIWSDYRLTKSSTAFLRSHSYPTWNGKTVLISSLSNSIYQVKLECALAVGLKLAGWRIKVLTMRRCTWAHRYFKVYGIHDFVFWEDIALTEEEVLECSSIATSLSLENLTPQKVKKWTCEGAWIGPQVLAFLSRFFKQGKPDLDDPGVMAEMEKALLRVLTAIKRSKKITSQISPNLMCINEANYMNGPLVDVAIGANIDVIQFTQPSREDALILKRLNKESRRIHPNSLSVKTLESTISSLTWDQSLENELNEELSNRYNGKWFLQNRNQIGTSMVSKQDIIQRLGLDPSKKCAIVFSHVLWDANLFYGDDLFEDYGDWFVETIRAACKNPNVNWIIKLHPANVWKRASENAKGELSEIALIRKFIGPLPNHIKLLYPDSNISTLSLFQLADYGITVRGTVGIELPCLGVTTLTAGTGRYSNLGFTIDSDSKEAYLEKLQKIESLEDMSQDQVILAKKHAYLLFRKRPWIVKSFRAEFFKGAGSAHPLASNLHLTARSVEEIAQNGDLESWALWARNPGLIDYLEGL